MSEPMVPAFKPNGQHHRNYLDSEWLKAPPPTATLG